LGAELDGMRSELDELNKRTTEPQGDGDPEWPTRRALKRRLDAHWSELSWLNEELRDLRVGKVCRLEEELRGKLAVIERRLADIESHGGDAQKPPDVELREDGGKVELRVGLEPTVVSTFKTWEAARESAEQRGLKVTRRTRMHAYATKGSPRGWLEELPEIVTLCEVEGGWLMLRPDQNILRRFHDKPSALAEADRIGLTVGKVEPLEKQEAPAVPQVKCPEGWVFEEYREALDGLMLKSIKEGTWGHVWFWRRTGSPTTNTDRTEQEGAQALNFLAFEIMRRRAEKDRGGA